MPCARLCAASASVAAPLLARKALFKKATSSSALTDVQWAYLGISLFTVLLAVAYYYVPLPDVTDEELEDVAERADDANNAEVSLGSVVGGGGGVGVGVEVVHVQIQV